MKRVLRVSVGAKGRVVLPAELRRSLGIDEGSELLARIDGRSLVLESREAVLERIRQRFGAIPSEVSLIDELIAERRAEAARENDK